MSHHPTHRLFGFGLLELLLVLGAISVMTIGIYAVFLPASVNAQVKREQDNLQFLSTRIERSFGLLGSFSQVSTDRVLGDGLAPRRMEQGDDLRTSWGTAVGVHPHAIARPGDAFVITYSLAPADVCTKLSAALARDAYDIRVHSQTVFTDGVFDPARAAEQCGQRKAAGMEFIYYSGLVAGRAVAAPTLILPPAPPSVSPPPSSPPVMSIPENLDVDDATPGTLPAPPASSTSPPPAPPPVTPPAPTPDPILITTPPPVPVTPPGVMCTPRTQARAPGIRTTTPCQAGYLGTITEQRSITDHYDCPEAWDVPQFHHTAYGAWQVVSNTCEPECVAPGPETETRNQDCPAGHLGTIVEERITTWTCPAATGPPASSTTSWAVITNTCAAECVVPNPSTQTQTQNDTEEREQECPAGQLGAVYQERPVERKRTRTASCPQATGSPQWGGWSSWSSWSPTGSWTTTGNTCADKCVLPSPSTQTDQQTRTGTRTLDCPAGEEGEINQTRPERRTRTRTASCPAATGDFVWSDWTGWGSWEGTASWTTTGNSCKPVLTGKCSQITRPIGWGCGVIRRQGSSWVHVPGSVMISGELNGGYLGNGSEGTRCVMGYIDTLTPQGYPSPLSSADQGKLVYDYVDRAPDRFDQAFTSQSDGSWVGFVGFGRVYARSPTAPVRGALCLNTKFEFINN